MIVDTELWVSLADACREAGVSQSTGYRTAKRLGIVERFFGVQIMRRGDVHRLIDERLSVGNNNWINSPEVAAESARKAVDSRMRRMAEQGLTKAERERNKFLATGKARRGGRMTPRAAKR